jgi:uncharacterized protein (DUF58 family)
VRTKTDDVLFDEAFRQRLDRLTLLSRRMLAQSLVGEHRSRHRTFAAEFADFRPYTQGDDFRHIDWNIYARMENVFVRLSEANQDLTVHMLLDASRSMDWGDPPKSFYSRRAAAALAYMALNRFDRLAITAFSDRLHGTFGPTRGRGSVLGLLDYLRAVEYRGETNVDVCLEQYSLRTRRRGDLLILLSDLFPPSGYQTGLRTLLERGWQVLVVHLFDPREVTPTLRGDLELIDQETDERLELTPTAVLLERYRALVGAWSEEVGSFCKRRAIDYVRVQTDWPFETLVLGYMEQLGLVQ